MVRRKSKVGGRERGREGGREGGGGRKEGCILITTPRLNSIIVICRRRMVNYGRWGCELVAGTGHQILYHCKYNEARDRRTKERNLIDHVF